MIERNGEREGVSEKERERTSNFYIQHVALITITTILNPPKKGLTNPPL